MFVKRLCFLLVTLVFLMMQGCAALKPIPAEQVPLNFAKAPKVLTIKNRDFSGKEISHESVVGQIIKEMSNSGEFNFYKSWRRYNNPVTDQDRVSKNVKGVKISSKDGQIVVRYLNGWMHDQYTQYVNATGKYVTYGERWSVFETVAKFKYSIVSDGDLYKVTINFPDSIENNEHYTWDKPIAAAEQVIADLSEKFDGLKNPTIQSSVAVSGEINSKYDSDSIYANFERIMGKFKFKNSNVTNEDIKKSNVFNYKYNGEVLPVYVEVFPYRNGSKLNYQMSLPYSVGNEYSITENNVVLAKKDIEKVVND